MCVCVYVFCVCSKLGLQSNCFCHKIYFEVFLADVVLLLETEVDELMKSVACECDCIKMYLAFHPPPQRYWMIKR